MGFLAALVTLALQTQSYPDTPIEVRCPIAPAAVPLDDGSKFLAYDLRIMNWGHADIILDSVEITADGKRMITYAAKDLEDPLRFWGSMPYPRAAVQIKDRSELRHIPPGRTAALFCWISLAQGVPVPVTLSHSLRCDPRTTMSLDGEPGKPIPLIRYSISVAKARPLVLGPLFEAGTWRCAHIADRDFHHEFLGVLDGGVWRSQSFAIDLSKVDDKGDALPSPFPDDIDNTMFYGYGSRVLAAASGTVSYVLDSVPENKPLVSGATNPPIPLTRTTFPGNQVGIKLGEGRYIFYAHLVPGSIPLKVGQRIERGQFIGLLGDSGNAAGPHLHFQACDRNDINASNGIPFVFGTFDLAWRTGESKTKPVGTEPKRHHGELPSDGSVVRF